MTDTPATPTLIVEVAREDDRRVQYAANGHLYCATASPFQAAKVVLAVNSRATLLHQRDALVKALEQAQLELDEAAKMFRPTLPGVATIYQLAAQRHRVTLALITE